MRDSDEWPGPQPVGAGGMGYTSETDMTNSSNRVEHEHLPDRDRLQRARDSLEGLSVGDALGENFFGSPALIEARETPPGRWPFTDDTQMALSIVEVLRRHGAIDQDALAASFAAHYEPWRAYGAAMHGQLRAIRAGASWRETAPGQFGGSGSFGNGAAMRVAPVGAWFADEPARAAEQAKRSAEVTHAHPEALAGAMAVAVAAALAWQVRDTLKQTGVNTFLEGVMVHVPESRVGDGIATAVELGPEASAREAASRLGSGYRISCPDTVPFTVWCAATNLGNYEEALWQCASGGGDVDTTCAIVGGIVATGGGCQAIPALWRERREALPSWGIGEGD